MLGIFLISHGDRGHQVQFLFPPTFDPVVGYESPKKKRNMKKRGSPVRSFPDFSVVATISSFRKQSMFDREPPPEIESTSEHLIYGCAHTLFAQMQIPPKQFRNRSFELILDEVLFLGFPTDLAREEGSTHHQLIGTGEVGTHGFYTYSVVVALSRNSPTCELIQGSAPCWIYGSLRKLARALIHEQNRVQFVSSQLHRMCEIWDEVKLSGKEKEKTVSKASVMTVCNKILSECRLAHDLKNVFEALHTGDCRSVLINSWIAVTCSLREKGLTPLRPYDTLLIYPPKSVTLCKKNSEESNSNPAHEKASAVEPHYPTVSLHESCPNLSTMKKAASLADEVYKKSVPLPSKDPRHKKIHEKFVDQSKCSAIIEPSSVPRDFTVRDLEKKKETKPKTKKVEKRNRPPNASEALAKELPADCSQSLRKMIRWANPFVSFHDLSVIADIPLPTVFRFAAHLCCWRKSEIIHTIRPYSRYCIHPDLELNPGGMIHKLFRKYFNKSLIGELQRFNEVRSIRVLQSRDRRSRGFEFGEMLIFLVQNKCLRPLYQYPCISPSIRDELHEGPPQSAPNKKLHIWGTPRSSPQFQALNLNRSPQLASQPGSRMVSMSLGPMCFRNFERQTMTSSISDYKKKHTSVALPAFHSLSEKKTPYQSLKTMNHLRVLKHGQSLASSRLTPQGSARITPYTLSRANSSGSKPSSAGSVPEMTPICDRDTKRAASEELRSSEKTPASESVSAKKSILLPKSAQHKDHELLRDLAPLLDGRHTEEEIIHKHPKLNEGAQGYKALKRLYEIFGNQVIHIMERSELSPNTVCTNTSSITGSSNTPLLKCTYHSPMSPNRARSSFF